MWLPMEIQVSGKRQRSNVGVNNTTSYQPDKVVLQSNIYDNQVKESTREIEKKQGIDEHKIKRKASLKELELDWEFYEIVNSILEYSNVVLNDIEIFASPEIYSSILRNFHHVLPDDAIDKMLNATYKITIDKNHRISNGRYNAMFSEDLIKSFGNIFCLY